MTEKKTEKMILKIKNYNISFSNPDVNEFW
jgi:hypothetical protein